MHESHVPTIKPLILYGCFAFAAIALAFLIWEHQAHALAWLPIALLALCPLLHLFMHAGHRHGGSDVRSNADVAGAAKE